MNPPTFNGKLDIDEPTLRKLSRAQLQKLAKENKVKANIKSDLIIKELLKLCNVLPLDQEEKNKEPPRKKRRTTLHDQSPSVPSRRASQECPPVAIAAERSPQVLQSSPPPVPQSPSPPVPQSPSPPVPQSPPPPVPQSPPPPVPQSHTAHQAAEDVKSDSGSDLSYASKQDYYRSPVSSRAGTPPLEEPPMLKRAVDIMDQITAEDQRIAAEIVSLRNRAAALKQQAKKVRDVVRAEQGRRVRLEAYFTYWREIAPKWPIDWIYQEGDPERNGEHVN